MEDYYHQNTIDRKANLVLNKLKMELSCRESNEHVGSGLGGNPTEYFFLLTHNVKPVGADEGEPSFSRVGSDEILFSTSAKPPMMMVRKAFTKFLDEEYPTRQRVTQAQLLSPSFMRDLGSNKLEIKLFIRALEHTYELVKWLDLKQEMGCKLSILCEQERDALANLFLKEMNLPTTYFEDHKNDKHDPMDRMLRKHPIWGARREAASKRYGEMTQKLVSPEDNENLAIVGAYPSHITLFIFRACIGIERIVSLNLDELDSCKFLSEINKEIDNDE